ncbi:MAG: type II toxin-antitoxin system HigA family antitoxin [Cyanobium sp.]
MQPIKPIRNEADYDLALQDIDRCLDAAAGSPERDRLEVLTVLVDDYEAKHHSISPPDPIAAIEFVLEQRGLSRKDLEGVIGSSGRISEVMNRQRPLSLAMIRKLVETFDLPADVLIRKTPRMQASGRSFVVTRAKRVKARVAV